VIREIETSPELDGNISLSIDPAIEELSRKMLSYSHLWFGTSENDELAEQRFQLRERLLFWLRSCLGRDAHAFVAGQIEDVSLAASAPALTAFLGRRAMLEISRRVLKDS
jgi:hypothetical protein